MDVGNAVKQLMEESETLLEYSPGGPRVLLGGGSLAMGCIIGVDAVRYLLFYPQIGVGKRLDGGRRRVKKYLWSF